VQEGVLPPSLGRELRAQRLLSGLEPGDVLGVLGDHGGELRLERLERLMGAELAPRLEVAAAQLFAARAGKARQAGLPGAARAAAGADRAGDPAAAPGACRLRTRLVLVLAQVADDAGGAGRRARRAYVAAVQDQPVMRILQVRARCVGD